MSEEIKIEESSGVEIHVKPSDKTANYQRVFVM